MTPSLNPYLQLCSRATPETLRRHPVTSPYLTTFFNVAKRNGLTHARAWLLGRLLLDLHPQPDTPRALPLQQDPYPLAPDDEPASSPRARLQQHIEAAAAHVDTATTKI